MAIFNSYVKLPEGNSLEFGLFFRIRSIQKIPRHIHFQVLFSRPKPCGEDVIGTLNHSVRTIPFFVDTILNPKPNKLI